MMRALELAAQAAAMGEVPVGAVVVQKSTGRIIGEGYNRREADRSPLAHAEIMAIDAASRTLGGWRLLDSALYVTLEPCPMCAGAILHARLEQVVYGTADPKGGAVDSVEQLFTLPYNWTMEYPCFEERKKDRPWSVFFCFWGGMRTVGKAERHA